MSRSADWGLLPPALPAVLEFHRRPGPPQGTVSEQLAFPSLFLHTPLTNVPNGFHLWASGVFKHTPPKQESAFSDVLLFCFVLTSLI